MRPEQISQAILDTAQGLICCMDIEGRITVFNKACQRLTGYSDEEVIGHHLWDVVIPPAQAAERRKRFALLKEGHISGGFEATWLIRDGGERTISWQTAILRDTAGAISGVVATGVDITERRKAELALAHEQAFVRALIDELPDGLIACDEGGRLKLMNRRVHEFHGHTDDAVPGLAGADAYNLYHPDGRVIERRDTPLEKALTGEHVRDYEMVVAPKDRRARFLLCSADPLTGADGNVIGAVVQMHDDTERRAAEQLLRQSEQRLREQNLQLECLFGLAREFTQTLDRARLAQSLDSAVRRISQLLGADNCRILLDSVEGALVTAHQASSAEGVWQTSVNLQRASGPFGKIAIYQSTPRNWKEGERRWLEAVADLVANAIERVEIVEDLAVQKQRALDASQAKTRFLANMSHEIRTPLNGVLGLVQILLKADDMPVPHHQTLAMVRNCGAHLLALVNDILDLSRIESGKLEFEFSGTRLHALVKELSDVFVVSARERGLGFSVHVSGTCPALIVSDERRLRQVLFNLIGNALKFTERGEVKADVYAAGGSIVFTVSDTGPGIPEEQLDRLFQAFERGSGHGSAPGTGLGLAISSRLAEGLGGRIEASSRIGKGSVFKLTIPNRPVGETTPAETLRISVSGEDPGRWAAVDTFSASFVARLELELAPAILCGDMDGIVAAVMKLHGEASNRQEALFLHEVARRAAAFEMASLYPLAGQIRATKEDC